MPKGKVAIYSRVSSADQKGDLERQKQKLVEYATSKGYQDIEMVDDVASGLNENRKGLNKLSNLVTERQIEAVFINYKDKITRFGFKYLETSFNSCGCGIETIDFEESENLNRNLLRI